MPPEISALVEKYWSNALFISVAVWFWRSRDALRDKNASLQAELSLLKESKADFKSESIKQIEVLKAENLELQKTIQNKYSDGAILSNYEFNEAGVAFHKQNKRPYCPSCLQNIPRKEVQLLNQPDDDYYRCPVGEPEKYHIYPKHDRQRHNQVYY